MSSVVPTYMTDLKQRVKRRQAYWRISLLCVYVSMTMRRTRHFWLLTWACQSPSKFTTVHCYPAFWQFHFTLESINCSNLLVGIPLAWAADGSDVIYRLLGYQFRAERPSAPWTAWQCRKDKKGDVEVPCQLSEAEDEEEYAMIRAFDGHSLWYIGINELSVSTTSYHVYHSTKSKFLLIYNTWIT